MVTTFPTVARAQTTAAALAFETLRELFTGIEPACAVQLPDGTTWSPPGTEPSVTIVVRNLAGVRRLLHAANEAALAEAYLHDDLDIEGDIFAVPAVARAILGKPWPVRQRLRMAMKLVRLPHEAVRDDGASSTPGPLARLRGARHTPERDRAAVTHHYDVSNAFYRLFLDESMVYSCAVFAHRNEDLARAQQRKLDLICRKLRLRPGEHFLDIGCGWGSLIMHAARTYDVDALGITLSERQAQLARERIEAAGLAHRCRVEIADYRGVPHSGAFDKIASVGMFEHVGFQQAAPYFQSVHRLLRPGGAYLHHAIVGNPRLEHHGRDTLSQRYVFPDTELIPLGQVLTVAEMCGLEARDLENLREHYALTLRRWIGALDARRADAVREVGEATYRAWRLVFAGAADCFDTCRQGVVQVLMVKPQLDGTAELPLQRTDWYR